MKLLKLFWFVAVAQAMLMTMAPVNQMMISCFNAAGNLYAFGYSCPKTSWKLRTNSVRCPCDDMRFVETFVNCLDRLAKNESKHYEADRNISMMALTHKCTNLTMAKMTPFLSNSSQLPGYEGDRSGFPSTWPVTRAFALTDKEIHDAWMVTTKNDMREEYNKRYGVALVVYWCGICVLQAIAHFAWRIFPLQWRYVHQSKFVRQWRHKFGLQPSKLGSVTRMQVLMVGVFLILSVLFSFIQLGAWYPDNTLMNNNTAVFGRVVGVRTGVISLYLMPLLLLFAGRNNFLMWLTGWPQDTFVMFHRWIARVDVAMILAHTIAYSVCYVARGKYKTSFGRPYWSWGIVGLAFGMFMCVQGVKFLRSRSYKFFLICHIISAILFLVGGYYHLKLAGYDIAIRFYYACFAIWGFDRAARLIRVLYNGFQGPKPANQGLWSYFGTPAKIRLEHNTLAITFDCPRGWSIIGCPGQIAYLHFMTPFHFWQSHPFTLVASPSEPGKLKVYARIYKGITQTLANKVMEQGTLTKESKHGTQEGYEMEMPILLDGPYGSSHDLFEYDELLMVAGGTGITAPFAYIQDSILKYPHNYQKIKLFWAVTTTLEKWFDEELRYLAEYHHIEVNLFYTRDEVNPTKFNVREALGAALSNVSGNTAVLCCGPEGMSQAVKQTVAEHILDTPYVLQYYEESFSF